MGEEARFVAHPCRKYRARPAPPQATLLSLAPDATQ